MRDALDPSNHEGHQEDKGFSLRHALSGNQGSVFEHFVFKIFSPENIWAFVLFLIVLALIIFTSDNSPIWIYQGF